jgi:hypothetical protein
VTSTPASGQLWRSAYIRSVIAVQAPRPDSSRPNGAGPVSAPPWAAGSSPRSAWPPASMRTPYGLSSLVTVAVAMVWSTSSLIRPSLISARPLRDAPGRRGAHGRPECRLGPPRSTSPEETCCTMAFAASRLPCVPLPPPGARSSAASLRLPGRKPVSRGRRAQLPGGQCPHAWRLPVRYRRRTCRARRQAAAARRRRVLRVSACPCHTGRPATPACRATSCRARSRRSSASLPGRRGWSC